MRVSVRVEGLKEMDAALGELSKATARNVLRKVLTKAGEPIAEAARQLVPVDSGALRDSIAVSAKLANPVGKAEFAEVLRNFGTQGEAVSAMRDARRDAKGSFAEMYVGAGQLPQAHMVEFGSVHNPVPKPYMRPAFDANKQRALDIIKAELGDEIAKAAARARARALRRAARGG